MKVSKVITRAFVKNSKLKAAPAAKSVSVTFGSSINQISNVGEYSVHDVAKKHN